MKFKKEIVVVVEGEIFDDQISINDLMKSLKWSYRHWWEDNPNWPYGRPSEPLQSGRINKITFEGVELK
jgi:hypothetical protein